MNGTKLFKTQGAQTCWCLGHKHFVKGKPEKMSACQKSVYIRFHLSGSVQKVHGEEMELAWGRGGGMPGEPFQGKDSGGDSSVWTPRLGPWHPEGQPTCRAKPLGIDTTPYMINSAATYNKCCTVYVTYFKIERTQHSCLSCLPLFF